MHPRCRPMWRDPKDDGPFPVVIVVSEIFGLHAYIQDVCRRLARQGYAAMAPGYFARAGDPARDGGLPGDPRDRGPYSDPRSGDGRYRRGPAMAGEPALGRCVARRDHRLLLGRNGGVDGLCGPRLQGRRGLLWASGRLQPRTPKRERRWPVDIAADLRDALCWAFTARSTRGFRLDTVEQMRAALASAGKEDCQIVVYPGADHGFHADYRPMYDETAATDAWSRLSPVFDQQSAGRSHERLGLAAYARP
jgi:carboxymethylenebutenolidase